MKVILGRHTWKSEVKPWAESIPYEAWREQVLKGQELDEESLRDFYAAAWDATDCRQYLLITKALTSSKKSRHVTLDLAAVNRRIGKAVWVECNKLRVRRLTPEAKAFVVETLARSEKSAGIGADDPDE